MAEAGNAARLDSLFAHPEPPSCPEGWSVGPPAFVGVGAPRSGTSWWYRVIGAHPDVCIVRGLHVKEVNFFSGLGDRAALTTDAVARYHSYFPRAPGGQLAGEWTPDYMYSGALPQQ